MGNRLRDSPNDGCRSALVRMISLLDFGVGRCGQWATKLEAPNTVPAGEKVEDVLTERGVASRLGVNLGVGQAGSITKKVFPHIGSGDLVGVAAAVMASQVVHDIRLTDGGTIRFEADIVFGENRTCDRGIVFNLSAQILFF